MLGHSQLCWINSAPVQASGPRVLASATASLQNMFRYLVF